MGCGMSTGGGHRGSEHHGGGHQGRRGHQGVSAAASSSAAPRPPPLITHTPLAPETIAEAIGHLRQALHRDPTLIGGVALSLLGSRRGTADIDILVAPGNSAIVASTLASSRRFGVEHTSSGQRVWYNASNRRSYNVDIVEPDMIGQYPPGHSGTESHRGGKILSPALLLNCKVYSWQQQSRTRDKKTHDAADIIFLVSYMRRNRITTSFQEVPNVTDHFFMSWLERYPATRVDFIAIGLQL